jgi:hypothetical protein
MHVQYVKLSIIINYQIHVSIYRMTNTIKNMFYKQSLASVVNKYIIGRIFILNDFHTVIIVTLTNLKFFLNQNFIFYR